MATLQKFQFDPTLLHAARQGHKSNKSLVLTFPEQFQIQRTFY